MANTYQISGVAPTPKEALKDFEEKRVGMKKRLGELPALQSSTYEVKFAYDASGRQPPAAFIPEFVGRSAMGFDYAIAEAQRLMAKAADPKDYRMQACSVIAMYALSNEQQKALSGATRPTAGNERRAPNALDRLIQF